MTLSFLFFFCFPFFDRDLSENNISDLPIHVFDKQIHLTQLFLIRNRIEVIPHGLFRSLTSLRWLFMQNNLLHTFPLVELSSLTSLEWFNLSTNHLKLENEKFPVLSNLSEL